MEENKLVSFDEILKRKIDYYGQTEAAYALAAEEFGRQYISRRPVFLIGLPKHFSVAEHREAQDTIGKGLGIDYHVIAYISTSNNFCFQMLAEKDYKEIDLTKIEETVKDIFK